MQKRLKGFPENSVVRVTTELEWCNVVATLLNLGYRWMQGDQGINLYTEYFREYSMEERKHVNIYCLNGKISRGIERSTYESFEIFPISAQEFLRNPVIKERGVRRIIIRNK